MDGSESDFEILMFRVFWTHKYPYDIIKHQKSKILKYFLTKIFEYMIAKMSND